MEHDLALRRHVIADQGRNTDSEIDRPALRDVARHPFRQIVAPKRTPIHRLSHSLLLSRHSPGRHDRAWKFSAAKTRWSFDLALFDLDRRVAGGDMHQPVDVDAGSGDF